VTAAAIVLAAGRGVRAGGPLPKQYRPLDGKSSLERSLDAFLACRAVRWLQPVIHPADSDLYARTAGQAGDERLLPPVNGGAQRQDSALAGLRALRPLAPRDVLIHDAARPFVTADVIDRVLRGLADREGVIPAIGIADGIWEVDGRRQCRAPMDRDRLCRAQTPQGFRFAPILAAHEQQVGSGAFDDASIARNAGIAVTCVPGDADNRKLTSEEDLLAAEGRLERGRDLRVGQGFDVHAFGAGTGTRLCGVDIPDCRTLAGHSDADVGLHALVDAIYGALALGDIGDHFPPDDPRWRDCDSLQFLSAATSQALAEGFRPFGADLTLICEAPRISRFRPAMRESIASCLGIPTSRVSVKATTTEGLGFVGRKEGIAAMAIATLQRRAS